MYLRIIYHRILKYMLPSVFLVSKQIAFNVIPHIDIFMKDGSTKEEWKMENETKKILDKNDLFNLQRFSFGCLLQSGYGYLQLLPELFKTPHKLGGDNFFA